MDPAENEEKTLKTSIPTDVINSTQSIEAVMLEVNQADDFSSEAYQNFVNTTLKEFSSIAASSEPVADEDILHVFHSLPSAGVRKELSIYTTDVPVASNDLVSMMMDVNLWAKSFSHIVCNASSNSSASILQQLSSSDVEIKRILMIDSELQLQPPSGQSQKICFLRLLKEINADTWVIFDVSNDYFLHKLEVPLEQKCWRRRSGLIIRKVNDYSRVVWIEDVEALECHLGENCFSITINSTMGMSAERWVKVLIWWKNRSESRSSTVKQETGKVPTIWLDLAEKMKAIFLDMVSATPDDSKWVLLHNQKLRLLRHTADHVTVLGPNKYVGVTTFRLEATPHEVLDILAEMNLDLQWPINKYSFERKEMAKFAAPDGTNCITLFKRVYEAVITTKQETLFAKKPEETVFAKKAEETVFAKKAEETVVAPKLKLKAKECLLQEISEDGFCSFIISAPIAIEDRHSYFGTGGDALLRPAGFAIVPDGPEPKGSMVTFVTHHPVNTSDAEAAVESMESLLQTMICDIERFVEEEMAGGLDLEEDMDYLEQDPGDVILKQ